MTNTPNQGLELLACPFCGGEELSHGFASGGGVYFGTVQCHTEGCGAALTIDSGEEEAIAAWNTRTTPTPASSGVLVEALAKVATRFDHCAEMISSGFNISGNLRAERAIKAKHYALEARQALSSASTDTGAREGEPKLKAARASDPDSQPEGTLEALETCASMLETYMPECMPANEHGQVDFVRCMTDATAAEIRAFLANQEQDNG